MTPSNSFRVSSPRRSLWSERRGVKREDEEDEDFTVGRSEPSCRRDKPVMVAQWCCQGFGDMVESGRFRSMLWK
jgi:hypothetical protein